MTARKVYRTELTPLSFLTRSAAVFPEKGAVVHGDRRHTYRQFEERVNRLASALRGAGLRHQDRVAFLCPNSPPMLEAHYGVPAAGGVLVAINTRLASEEIQRLSPWVLATLPSRVMAHLASTSGLPVAGCFALIPKSQPQKKY